MRRTAPVNPPQDSHHHPHIPEYAGGSLDHHQKQGKAHKSASTSRRSLIKCFALLIALFFVVTFYSVLHLSDIEKSASFLIPSSGNSSSAHSSASEASALGGSSKEHQSQQTKRSAWAFDKSQAEQVQRHFLQTTGRTSPPLTAYIEQPLQNNTAVLPLRTQAPNDLLSFTYPQVNGCKNLQAALPTLHSMEMDHVYGGNTFNTQPLYPRRFDYARQACPVDADPFLPWIHDVFSSNEYVEFIAHNKRRCNTDPNVFHDDLNNLEPQVSIMQPVPVKRITDEEAQSIAPDLWNDNDVESTTTRYRLVNHEEADDDGRETRFLCRFYTFAIDSNNTLRKVVLGETLSVYPYNYEFANYKKPGSKPMLTPGKDQQIWNSVLHVRCPIPVELQSLIASGQSVVNNVASVYLDLVPIRTRPRRMREGYMVGVKTEFNANKEWGSSHVLPLIEASGRYSNIPVCHPPILEVDAVEGRKGGSDSAAAQQQQGHGGDDKSPRHLLVGCLWASASYTTRGGGVADTSTSDRLLEWLVYHLYIAKFDHIYVYDNTGAFSNEATSLEAVTKLFPTSKVTRIPWPHRVCNNNRPMHSNPGERSSQYAAEASCRVRYGPHTIWMAPFDADEYLIAQGNWSDIKQWLREGVDANTHILSFFQTRAHPIADLMEPYTDGRKCGRNVSESKCLSKREDATFMETYDCETTPLPKPDFGWRAKKQIFRPRYVLNHYVHYSVVTKRILDAPTEVSPRFVEKYPYERRVNELDEGFMLHTKTTSPETTLGWKEKCAKDGSSCPVGIPWPVDNMEGNASVTNKDGLKYNCYRHERVSKDALPRLRSKLMPFKEKTLDTSKV